MSDGHALDLLVRKLRSHSFLDEGDAAGILALPHQLRTVSPAAYLVREGEPPSLCGVLVTGFAFRQKITGNGDRSILSLHIPGEPLDFQSLFLDRADHNAQALTEATVAMIPVAAIREVMRRHPAVAAAILTLNQIEASISREWLVNIARRDARSRLAHLLCEFAVRMDLQKLHAKGTYVLPMSQEQIGDALGLTAVHVNRTIKGLELDGLLIRKGRTIEFPSIAALSNVGDFNRLYLHCDGKPVWDT